MHSALFLIILIQAVTSYHVNRTTRFRHFAPFYKNTTISPKGIQVVTQLPVNRTSSIRPVTPLLVNGTEPIESLLQPKANVATSMQYRCILHIDSGVCLGYHPMYAYDVEQRKCVKFIYSGCMGNANRFNTSEECERFCGPPNRAVTENVTQTHLYH
ncbi:unnamed protein product [Calicophoron daubneyi]|uniref:BPTI/Kunitz inhibitor domain-containing protein n=1 Tax=Calicophoron daubneyi TaxID=300641 RepID=A0AAV2TFG4_CALDB